MIVLFIVVAVAVYLGVTAANNPERTAAAVLRVRYGLKYTVLSLIALGAVFTLADRLGFLAH